MLSLLLCPELDMHFERLIFRLAVTVSYLHIFLALTVTLHIEIGKKDAEANLRSFWFQRLANQSILHLPTLIEFNVFFTVNKT